MRLQLRIQLVEHQPRLDTGPPLSDVEVEDRTEVLRGIHDQAGADRLSGLRRAAAAHRDRAAERRAYRDEPDQVVSRAWDNYADRFDLIDAGVGGVERARDLVEMNLARELGGQGALESCEVEAADIGAGLCWCRDDRQCGHRARSPSRSCARPRASVSPPLPNDTRSVPSPAGP